MTSTGAASRPRDPSRAVRAMALLAVALLLGSCRPEAREPDRPSPVRAVVLPYLTHLPLHIAREEGFFAARNLDVEFVRLGRQQDIMAALARGEIDVAAGMLTVNELSLALADYPVRIVAALGEQPAGACPFVAVVARRELSDSGALADPARIRELRFDITPTLPLAFLVDRLLHEYDLGLGDVEQVNLPPPAAVDALQSGSIDVTVDSEPFVTRHLQTGDAVVWRSMSELLPGFQSSVLMFGPTMLEEVNTGERFATAVLAAMRQLRRGKTPRNLDIAERALGLTREEVAGACWPVVPATGEIDPLAFREFERWAVERSLVARVPEDAALFDGRFIRAANARLEEAA